MYVQPLTPEDIDLPAKGFASKVVAYNSAVSQLIPNVVLTRVTFDTEVYDPLGEFDNTVGNYSFTPRQAGWYLIIYQQRWTNAGPAGLLIAYFDINGGLSGNMRNEVDLGEVLGHNLIRLRHLTPNDVLSCRAQHTCGANKWLEGGIDGNVLTIQRIA